MGKPLPAIEEVPDIELVSRCLAGNAEARDLLYREYFGTGSTVYFWVFHKASWIPEGDKEDVLNDIFLAVMESLENFAFKSSLRTYITRIAKMKCIDAMPTRLGVSKGKGIRFVDVDQRQSDGEPVYQIEDTGQGSRADGFFDTMEEKERVHLLHAALIHYTGPRCREVLQLYIRELHGEISREDMADILGVSVESAGHMIYDCFYRLRKRIQKNHRDYRHFFDCINKKLTKEPPRIFIEENT